MRTALLTTDDRPGKVVPYVDITGATFFNFLTQNSRFFNLTLRSKRALRLDCLSRGQAASRLPTARAIGLRIATISPADAD